MKYTDKQIRAYLKCRADLSSLGVPTVNDEYNLRAYGATRETISAIGRIVHDAVGLHGDRPRTVGAVRSILRRAGA